MNESPKKQLIRKVTDLIWNQRDLDSAVPLFHKEMTYTGPRLQVSGRDEYCDLIRGFMDIITESSFTMHEMVEEGDKVFCRGEVTGKHTGPYGEVRPTNNPIKVQLMALMEIKDNQILSETEIFDEYGMLCDMGMEIVEKEQV